MNRIILFVVLLFVCLSLALEVQPQSKIEFLKKRIQGFESNMPQIRYSTATGTAHLVTENPKNLAKRSTYGSVSEGLEAFLASHPEIGITDVKTQLVELSRRQDAQIKTLTMITYQQVFKGLNVHGCLLKVMINTENQVISVSGTIVPDLDLDVVPDLTEDKAVELARTALSNDMTYDIAKAILLVYRTDLSSGKTGTNHLAYHVTFKCTQHFESHFVYVDAHSGTVLDSFSPVHHALNRTAVIFGVGTVFTEGDPLPDDPQSRLAVEINGVEYRAMMNVGGWDSWDLNGGEFRNTINVPTNGYPEFKCPNAAFVGAPIGAIYCPGFAYAIDVIAHEFGHGYIQGIVGDYGLVYQGQSGALNEGYADIMGETMQILLKAPEEYPPRSNRDCTVPNGNQRWILADNLPTNVQTFPNINGDNLGLRDMYNPNCYRDPATTLDPNFACNPAYDNGGVHTNSGVLNQVYSLVVDGGDFNGTSVTGVGLTKAFHIFMRGLAKHIPYTTFKQHADYVEAACTELVNANVDLTDLLNGTATGLQVTTDDCGTLNVIYDLVQMRGDICSQNSTLPDPLIIAGPFPPVVMDAGIDFVFWQTFGFAARGSVVCRFVGYENQAYPGGYLLTQYSEYSYYCQMPSFPSPGIYPMQISPDNVLWWDPFNITVVESYIVTGASPLEGPIGGGTTIQFSGQGFVSQFTGCNPTASSDGFDCSVCYFGDEKSSVLVPASVSSSSQASCVTPDWNILNADNKTIGVYLSMNYFLAAGPIPFDYIDAVPGAVPVGKMPMPSGTPLSVRTPIAPPKPKVVSMANIEVVASSVLILSSVLFAMLY